MIYILPILAVLASFVFVWITKPKKQTNFRLLLAFSGAFLLALTFFELLPEVYSIENSKNVAVFIMVGILLQVFLEFFSKGAEHGHMHINPKNNVFPWMLFLSLALHALLEGLPIEKNNSIIYGILIHKIPIAIILSIFLINSNIKVLQGVFFMVLFSLMTPLGTYLSANWSFISTYGSQLNAIVIGVFLHISTVILFESAEGHSFNLRKLLVIVLGIIFAYLL